MGQVVTERYVGPERRAPQYALEFQWNRDISDPHSVRFKLKLRSGAENYTASTHGSFLISKTRVSDLVGATVSLNSPDPHSPSADVVIIEGLPIVNNFHQKYVNEIRIPRDPNAEIMINRTYREVGPSSVSFGDVSFSELFAYEREQLRQILEILRHEAELYHDGKSYLRNVTPIDDRRNNEIVGRRPDDLKAIPYFALQRIADAVDSQLDKFK